MTLTKIVRWPDGTWVLHEEFDYERDWAWKSDDYEIVEVTTVEYELL